MGDNNKPISEKIDALPVSSTTCEGRLTQMVLKNLNQVIIGGSFLTYPNETQENTRHKRPPRSKRRRYGR